MTDWSEDFSYEYYVKLLEALKENFVIQLISRAEFILPHVNLQSPSGTPVCFLRHDIDVSIEKALRMATIEEEMGIAATYYVRLNAKFYTLNMWNLHMLNEIRKQGHEIGLHSDRMQCDDTLTSCTVLESLIHTSVRTISFHIPESNQLQKGLRYCGLINAYAPALCKWYISDSSARWRDGEPLPQLKNPKGKLLQIVTHPIWWGKKTIDKQWKDEIVRKLREGI